MVARAAHEAVPAHHGKQLPAAVGAVLPFASAGAVHPGRHGGVGGDHRGADGAGRGGVRACDAGPAQ